MGYIENYTQFVTDRLDALRTLIDGTRADLVSGGFTVDKFVGNGLKFWLDGFDGWWSLVPFGGVDATPILYGTVGPSATTFTDFVAVPPLPIGAIPNVNTGLVALRKTGSGATATITTTMDTPTTLKVALSSLSGQQSGELYQNVTAYADPTGKEHIVAITLLRIS